MLSSVESYLSNRTFRIRIGTALSNRIIQGTGVPQGGVLYSCTLFIVKINSLHSSIPRSVFYSVYVDDVQVGFRSCNLAICERQVQLGLNSLYTG